MEDVDDDDEDGENESERRGIDEKQRFVQSCIMKVNYETYCIDWTVYSWNKRLFNGQ